MQRERSFSHIPQMGDTQTSNSLSKLLWLRALSETFQFLDVSKMYFTQSFIKVSCLLI